MKKTFGSMCGFGRREYELTVDGTLYNFVNNNRPAAVQAITNIFGIAVWLEDGNGEECVAAWNNGDSYSGAHRHVINYSGAGRPYIKKGGSRYYLDDFIRA